MSEIRFPSFGRRTRSTSATASSQDPLKAMAEQIAELDRAAARAAAGIQQAADRATDGATSGSSANRADLLAGLGSALVDRAEEIRDDCKRLSELLDRTVRLVADRDADAAGETAEEAAAPPPVEELPPLPAFEPIPAEPALGDLFLPPNLDLPRAAEPEIAARRSAAADREAPHAASEGVRLIATQMAIAGSNRTEIERRLRSQFGVSDADLALDDIFGRQGENR
jgi:hypothetical protein